jgi:hypothetical protein
VEFLAGRPLALSEADLGVRDRAVINCDPSATLALLLLLELVWVSSGAPGLWLPGADGTVGVCKIEVFFLKAGEVDS